MYVYIYIFIYIYPSIAVLLRNGKEEPEGTRVGFCAKFTAPRVCFRVSSSDDDVTFNGGQKEGYAV